MASVIHPSAGINGIGHYALHQGVFIVVLLRGRCNHRAQAGLTLGVTSASQVLEILVSVTKPCFPRSFGCQYLCFKSPQIRFSTPSQQGFSWDSCQFKPLLPPGKSVGILREVVSREHDGGKPKALPYTNQDLVGLTCGYRGRDMSSNMRTAREPQGWPRALPGRWS